MSETEQETGETTETETPDTDGGSDDDAAEAEDDDDAAGGEPEPEPDAVAPGLSLEAQQRLQDEREKRVKGAITAYARKIGDIFGDDAVDLVECPLCPPFHPGFVNIHDAGHVPADIMNAVTMFLGYAREVEYKQSARFHTCDACDGLGKVTTGSRVPNQETRTCPTCKGYGFEPPVSATDNGSVALDTAVLPPVVEPSGAGVPDVDPSGEPRLLPNGIENPNYGKWPQYKIRVEPWGVTANLTAQDAVA